MRSLSCTYRGVAALASLRADQKRSADPREQVGGLSPLEAQAPRGVGLCRRDTEIR